MLDGPGRLGTLARVDPRPIVGVEGAYELRHLAETQEQATVDLSVSPLVATSDHRAYQLPQLP